MKKAALTLALLSALASSGSVFGTEVSTTPLGAGEVRNCAEITFNL